MKPVWTDVCRPYYPTVRSRYCFGLGGGYLLQQMINRISLPSGLYPMLAQRRYSVDFALTTALEQRHSRGLSVRIPVRKPSDSRNRYGILQNFETDWHGWRRSRVLVLGLAGDAFVCGRCRPCAYSLSIWMIFFARPLSVFTGLLPFRGFNLRGAFSSVGSDCAARYALFSPFSR